MTDLWFVALGLSNIAWLVVLILMNHELRSRDEKLWTMIQQQSGRMRCLEDRVSQLESRKESKAEDGT